MEAANLHIIIMKIPYSIPQDVRA